MAAMNTTPRILVLGGTGFVGRRVAQQLSQLGWRVTVPTRRLSQAAPLQAMPGVTAVQANVHRDADLAGLVQGHDAVVSLVAILHGSPADFEQVHVHLPARLAAAMQKAGVQRLVHVSALGADADGPSAYQRSKARGEAVLQAADLALTVLRPSVIFGEQDRFLNLFAQLQKVFPVMPLAGAHTRFQPVWVDDVASAVVVCLTRSDVSGQVFELAGPDVLSLQALVQLTGQWAGVRGAKGRPVWPLPHWAGWCQAALLECLPGQPLMSRDNLASMKVHNTATGQHPGLQALGIVAGRLSDIAPGYLQPRR